MNKITCAFDEDALRLAISTNLWGDCNKQDRFEMLCSACRENAFGETNVDQFYKAQALFAEATKGLKS